MQFKKMFFLIILPCLLKLLSAAPIEKIMVDMTHDFDENIPYFPMFKRFEMTVVVNGSSDPFEWLQAEEISTATHMGTHMDAPSHFIKGAIDIEQIPISTFIAPAAVINIVEKTAEDPNAEATVEDFQDWERTTGRSLDGTIVLVHSGWGKKWHNRTEFIGTAGNDITKLSFPGMCGEAAQWLVDNRDIKGVGTETLSIDIGSSTSYPSHVAILGKGLYILENVANIDKIPIYGALLHVMPMKIAHASGAATRIIATYPKVIFDH